MHTKLTTRMIGTLKTHQSSPAGILVGDRRTINALMRRGLAEGMHFRGRIYPIISDQGRTLLDTMN